MNVQLAPLADQVIVITGASSGIGLVTAKIAAARGACVVLTARNDGDLRAATEAIGRRGGRATWIAADIAEPSAAEAIADRAIADFGRIDTWVNNAAVSVYGRTMELSIADMRRQFDVNYWGQVYGSRAAVARLRARGGALVNVASAVADRAIPLQGNYCATKHAIKAFTDALRMELEEEGAPISVTLIKPASIDTPFFDKAKSQLGVEPQPVPPVYAPDVVARAILTAAETPVRDLIVGGSGKLLSVSNLVPRLADRYMERRLFAAQQTTTPLQGRPDNLYGPVPHDGGERGRHWAGRTKGTSAYTYAALHPRRAAVLTAVCGSAAAAAMLWERRRRARSMERRST